MVTFLVPLALVLVATVCDWRRRLIPDWVPALVLAWGVAATAFGLNGVGWLSLLGGLGLGFLVGVVLFALQGLGGGDVKLLTALGAALGAAAFLGFLFWTALAGGLLAVVAALRGKSDLAYAPAIALGLVLFLVWQGELAHVLAAP